MAKYRHRIFEMYEFRDEATRALTPKSARPVTEATASEWTFEHLAVSRSESVTHVQFKRAQAFGQETISDLREDFDQLADKLMRNSQVLFDFAGVTSFSSDAIEALAGFEQTLKIKGSRIALCCLDPSARQSFFVKKSGDHEERT